MALIATSPAGEVSEGSLSEAHIERAGPPPTLQGLKVAFLADMCRRLRRHFAEESVKRLEAEENFVRLTIEVEEKARAYVLG